MKKIVIGPSLSGKTTLVRLLRSMTMIFISEIDEELVNRNSGIYPQDFRLKHEILIPQIIDYVLSMDEIIFFTNTDYFTVADLQKAKKLGFTIIQLEIDLDALLIRNHKRVVNEGYDSMEAYLADMLEYQETITNEGLIDTSIDVTRSVEFVAHQILN